MRLPGAGTRGGVELADVVADLVRAQLRELRARADAGGATVARQGTRHQPRDREVERLDERLGDRPRTLPRGRRLQQRRAHRARTTVVDSCIR